MPAQQRAVAAAVAAVLFAPVASATNGYFSHGWGTNSKAMAGVAAALPQDTLVGATNPAGMAFVGNRLDVGVSFFNPSDRGYKANDDYARQPNGFPAGPFVTPGKYDSDKDWFLIPSFGYNRVIDEKSTIGVSIFGNGGMNTKYKDRPVWENFALPPNMLVGPDGNPLMPPQFDPTCQAPKCTHRDHADRNQPRAALHRSSVHLQALRESSVRYRTSLRGAANQGRRPGAFPRRFGEA